MFVCEQKKPLVTKNIKKIRVSARQRSVHFWIKEKMRFMMHQFTFSTPHTISLAPPNLIVQSVMSQYQQDEREYVGGKYTHMNKS